MFFFTFYRTLAPVPYLVYQIQERPRDNGAGTPTGGQEEIFATMAAVTLAIEPIEAEPSFGERAYAALRRAITSADIYASREEIRLDERQLSQRLGISRTPIREALGRLEQEGLVRSVPRRGVFIVRKTKTEIIALI